MADVRQVFVLQIIITITMLTLTNDKSSLLIYQKPL